MYIHVNTCIYISFSGSRRLPKELRDSFAKVCEDRNQTASKVIKSFMEDYVKKAKDGDGK